MNAIKIPVGYGATSTLHGPGRSGKGRFQMRSVFGALEGIESLLLIFGL